MSTIVKVLILADADGSFVKHNHHFGLTELVDTLRQDVSDGLTFEVTTAHRFPNDGSALHETAVGCDIPHFRFDNPTHFTVAKYDQVWLFGFGSSNPDGPYHDDPAYVLTDPEIDLLGQFMDNGGGIFATGDHDDLGKDLCGKVPRVRSMRRWHFDYKAAKSDYSGYNESSLDSPPGRGVHRHTTIVKAANGFFEFDNQSDDLPQTIEPVLTHIAHKISLLHVEMTYPHPLLCGPNGVIDVLPDHMHEGECQVPDAQALAATFVAGGVNRDEYPKYQGAPLKPQIVAFGHVAGRGGDPAHPDPGKPSGFDDNEPVAQETFGLIAAWDGHVVSRGRVVVDSTFHHFVNVNVIGVGDDLTHKWASDEAIKQQGFTGSTQGQAAYKKIRHYWRNIARWISPPSVQTSFSLHWIKVAARAAHLHEAVGGARASMAGLARYGQGVHKYLGNWLTPCQRLHVSSEGMINPLAVLLGQWFLIKTLPDPPPPDVSLRDLPVNMHTLAWVALGAASLRTRELIRSGKDLTAKEHRREVQHAVGHAVTDLLQEELQRLEGSAAALRRLLTGSRASVAQDEHAR